MMTRTDAKILIDLERTYQIRKWGTIEQHPQDIAGYALIAEREVSEAIDGWLKNKPGRNSPLHELLQAAAVCIAALEQHGDFDELAKHSEWPADNGEAA